RNRNLVVYRDSDLRQHALNAVAVETGRGWRLAKEKAARKIDGVVALSFACLDAVERRPLRPARVSVPRARIPGVHDPVEDALALAGIGTYDASAAAAELARYVNTGRSR